MCRIFKSSQGSLTLAWADRICFAIEAWGRIAASVEAWIFLLFEIRGPASNSIKKFTKLMFTIIIMMIIMVTCEGAKHDAYVKSVHGILGFTYISYILSIYFRLLLERVRGWYEVCEALASNRNTPMQGFIFSILLSDIERYVLTGTSCHNRLHMNRSGVFQLHFYGHVCQPPSGSMPHEDSMNCFVQSF